MYYELENRTNNSNCGNIICYRNWFAIHESNKCNRHVKFTDDTEMDCRKVNSYNDGTSHIRTCDGSLIIVPTLRVKEITEIKTND